MSMSYDSFRSLAGLWAHLKDEIIAGRMIAARETCMASDVSVYSWARAGQEHG